MKTKIADFNIIPCAYPRPLLDGVPASLAVSPKVEN